MTRMITKRTHYMPGFTVLELAVVMLLSGIVIGIMYLYFTQFQNYVQRQSIHDDVYTELGLFNRVLENDLEYSDEIRYTTGKELILHTGKEELTYRFRNSYIIRYNEHARDTFYFETNRLDVNTMKKYSKLVSDITFDLVCNDELLPFSFHKNYSAQILFTNYKQP